MVILDFLFKLVIFQKLIKIFLFYKKCLEVYTVSFEIGANVKAIRGALAHFFTKINFGFYLKALSANYKLVFIEFKNII